MSRTLILTILTVIVTAGCTPAAPTVSPALATQENATALAAANSMLTATRAAMPTHERPTLVPPPDTPPGFNFNGTPDIATPGVPVTGPASAATLAASAVPSASLAPTSAPVLGPTSLPTSLPVTGVTLAPPPAPGTVDCNHYLNAALAGPTVRLAIRNDTPGPIQFSMGLSAPNSTGQCGYMAWPPINKANKLIVNVPASRPGDPCYWAYVVMTDPRSPARLSGSGFCLLPAKRWVFDVSNTGINLSAH